MIKNIEKDWDIVISSNNKLLNLELKAVWDYRDLIWLFVKRDFISFYKQTILGPIWFFVQPIFITITYVLIFGKLANISTNGVPQPLFYLAGITSWSYFSETLLKVSSVFRDNTNIFGKIYFPRLIIPLSIVFSNLIKFFVQFLLLILIFLYYIFTKEYLFVFDWYLLLLPLIILLLVLQSLGFGMIYSALTTKYRDLSLLLGFGIQLFMYATPVIYPMSILSPRMKFLVGLNPISYVIEGFRKALFGIGEFNLSIFFILLFVSIVTAAIGMIVFNKVQKNFIDTI
jgi:lipopolysaccharide transport system permease protein